MRKSLRIFDGSTNNDDNEYQAHTVAHPDDFIANIPRSPYGFEAIMLHCHASCPDASYRGTGKSLTADTQWKLSSPSLEAVEEIARHSTNKPFKHCQSPKIGGCGRFWDRDGRWY